MHCKIYPGTDSKGANLTFKEKNLKFDEDGKFDLEMTLILMRISVQ